MTDVMVQALASIVEAARAWRPARTAAPDDTALGRLATAVDALEETLTVGGGIENQPTGADHQWCREWKDIPAGWFVQSPKGDWIEVVASTPGSNPMEQIVSLRIGDKVAPFARKASDEVWACPGTSTAEMDRAMTLLSEWFGATHIRSGEQYGS